MDDKMMKIILSFGLRLARVGGKTIGLDFFKDTSL